MLEKPLFSKEGLADSFPSLTPAQLETQLEAAKHAETPAPSQYFPGAGANEAEYPYLSSLLTQGDGVWACCCGHENELDDALFQEDFVEREQEVRFCIVCDKCGLSYRAVKHAGSIYPPETCHCGNEFDNEWRRYQIGSVDAYRRDPVKAAHDAKHELCLRRSEKIYDEADTETMRRQRIAEERQKEMEKLRFQAAHSSFSKME
ncbi:hypothetical protein EKO04_009635 [Ascochyta lentis]|uniref:Probable double zinc ribbon domain-containing protein n=1 Tax=Ascochyta lentis TaxID=205686 RepID=A0A8H7IXD9_9PLEO|nr:hypothetical protein EKO04_009635 [Ascochyta lentis]